MSTPEDICAAMLHRVHDAEALIASCHRRRACPTCRAAIGEPCRHVANGRPLKHPHDTRWTQDVPRR